MALKVKIEETLRIASVYYADLAGAGVVLPVDREVRYSYYDSAVKLNALEYRQPSLMESLAMLKRNEELHELLSGRSFYIADEAQALVPGHFSLLDDGLVHASAPLEGDVRIIGGQSQPLFSVDPSWLAASSSAPFVVDASGAGSFWSATALVGVRVKLMKRK